MTDWNQNTDKNQTSLLLKVLPKAPIAFLCYLGFLTKMLFILIIEPFKKK